MMIIVAIITCMILGFISETVADNTWDDTKRKIWFGVGIVQFVIAILVLTFGCLHGFINYPKTEGTQVGTITAIDLEGVCFRRYEVYIRSGVAQEDKYLIYDYEEKLAKQLKDNVGKEVKITYGHDGGYIGWNSCGTTHVKKIEKTEE